MKAHRRLFLFVVFLSACVTAFAGDQPPLKVLFIGNSYTYVNDLPSLIVGLADSADGRKIETDGHLVGGCTLEQHVKDRKAIDKIRVKRWDAVVLQEHSLQPIINRESMYKHARILDGEIKTQGAKTIFYLTWARQNLPEMLYGSASAKPPESLEYPKAMYRISGAAETIDFDAWCKRESNGLAWGLNGAYSGIAKELGATVAPVGVAWTRALATDPTLVLHQADRSHPNLKGSYLAACVFYATLLDRSPVGLPGELRKGGRLLVNGVNGKRDRSDIGNRGKQTWAVTSRWPPRPAARCPADPASGTPIPGRDAWQSVSAIPSRHTAARAGRCGVAPPTRSRCRRD